MATLTTESYNLIKASGDIAVEGFYREDSLRQIFPVVPNLGSLNDNYARWQVLYDGSNNAESYTEDAPAPVAGYLNHAQALIAIPNYQASFKITGQVANYVRSPAAYVDAVISEQSYALRNLTDKINTSMVTSLQSQVDASNTHGSLTRATVGMTSYYVDYGNDNELLPSDMDTMVTNLMGATYGSPYPMSNYVCLMNATTYSDLQANLYADAGASRAQLVTQTGATSVDGSVLRENGTWSGIPILFMPRMTDGYVLMGPRDVVRIVETKRPTTELLGKVNDADQYLITSYAQLIVTQPRYWGKLIHTA
jgi:hypothetical protein